MSNSKEDQSILQVEEPGEVQDPGMAGVQDLNGGLMYVKSHCDGLPCMPDPVLRPGSFNHGDQVCFLRENRTATDVWPNTGGCNCKGESTNVIPLQDEAGEVQDPGMAEEEFKIEDQAIRKWVLCDHHGRRWAYGGGLPGGTRVRFHHRNGYAEDVVRE